MITMVTAHSAKPGMADKYEQFMHDKKLDFVRSLPKVTNYTVYRTQDRFDPTGLLPKEKRYDMVAIIEYDGTQEELTALYSSEKWINFMDQYLHMIEEDAPLYFGIRL